MEQQRQQHQKKNLITITVRSAGAYKNSNFVSHVVSWNRNDKRSTRAATTKSKKLHNQDGEWNNESEGKCFPFWKTDLERGNERDAATERERERGRQKKRTQMKANWMRPKHKRMKISGKKRKNWNNKLMNHLKNKLRMKMNLLRYCCMGSNYRSWRNGISALTAIIFSRLLQIFPNKTKKKRKSHSENRIILRW